MLTVLMNGDYRGGGVLQSLLRAARIRGNIPSDRSQPETPKVDEREQGFGSGFRGLKRMASLLQKGSGRARKDIK